MDRMYALQSSKPEPGYRTGSRTSLSSIHDYLPRFLCGPNLSKLIIWIVFKLNNQVIAKNEKSERERWNVNSMAFLNPSVYPHAKVK